MKTILLLSASLLGAEPTMKERILEMRLHELEIQLAAAKFTSAQQAQQNAVQEHGAATKALEIAKLEACKSMGGKTIDDCEFSPDAVKLKPKPEKK